MASAVNMHDGEAGELHLLQTKISSSEQNNADTLASCVDESSCDHFCHLSSHMIGFISCAASLQAVDATLFIAAPDEAMDTLSLDPPSQPPRS